MLSSDLVVSGSLGMNPNPVTAGNSATLTYTLKNQGGSTANASTTRIQVKNATNTTTIYDQSFSEAALAAGATRGEQFTIPILAGTTAGSYNVYVILDQFNAAGQGSNTGNDITSGTVSVSPGLPPNAIEGVDYSFTRPSP